MSTGSSDLLRHKLSLDVAGTALDIALVRRGGKHAPILFLHGFGSTKEDYIDFVHYADFQDRAFVAYDAPGCGETVCSDLSQVSIAFQVSTAEAILSALGIDKFHLQGHSMGGLTALLLAHRNPTRVLSFVNIKGNLAPEDCFLSRQIISHSSGAFFEDFVERTRTSPYYSSALYAASLAHKVQEGAVYGIFTSMVDLSDNSDLLAKFMSLQCPRMFMYGNQYASLSYLTRLDANGVELAEISHSGHFPMYSNPVAMWQRIAAFVSESERKHAKGLV